MARERLQDGSGEIWKAAKWASWVAGILVSLVTALAFVFMTFETKADAEREITAVKSDVNSKHEDLKSDLREIRHMVTEIYKLEREK